MTSLLSPTQRRVLELFDEHGPMTERTATEKHSVRRAYVAMLRAKRYLDIAGYGARKPGASGKTPWLYRSVPPSVLPR